MHALSGRFLVVDNGEYKLHPKPYDVVSQALRGGQPELRKRLFQEGQMPCEPKQYPQESYDHCSRLILSSIHERESKPSNLSRDTTELLVHTTVIEPTRRHSAPEEYSPRRIIKLPRSDSDRTVKISNSDSSSSPALGPDDCSARAVSDGSIKAANASDISQKPVDDLDLVCHDIESVDGSKDSSDDHMSSVYELLKSCSMTDVATESERLSAGESNLSCKNESSNCAFGNSKDWMPVGFNDEDVRTCEGISVNMFDSGTYNELACHSAMSGLSKESHVDGDPSGGGYTSLPRDTT